MEVAGKSGPLTKALLSSFHDLAHRRAEIIYGKENQPAISRWVSYWTDTLSRNAELVNAFRSRIEFDFSAKTVLDVGCGTGGLSQIVTEEDGIYIGCDFVFWMLELARTFADQLPQRKKANFLHAFGMDLPLVDKSVDIVVAFDVIEHLEGGRAWQLSFLKEVRRVLRRNGLLLLTTPNRLYPLEGHTFLYGPQYMPVWLADVYIRWKNPSFIHEVKTYGKIHLLTPWKMKNLLDEAGLKVVHDFPWGMDMEDYPPQRRTRLKLLNAFGLGWCATKGFWFSACRAADWEEMRTFRRKEWLRG
ncbi:MAG: class I SAM-dependent methyltransferase [Acidobacteria bacterium]|nr:class I SAM-dependent methyltransferase [Acidobacteriota bacterium]